MAALSLRIHIVDGGVTKTMQFDPSTSVSETCDIIRDKIFEAAKGEPKDYGLFLSDEDAKKGVWLEPGRTLEYYILRNGDLLEYRKKLRTLRVQMLDGAVKTLIIDDSQPVANLMVVICTKLGITNHDEYGLIKETPPEDEPDNRAPNFGTLTLRRKQRHEKDRAEAKMEQLRRKLKTDDDLNWIDASKTLREQGVNEGDPVLLRRKFFFSDGNIDSHDPVQLNLLYVQARDAILDGTHPVTEALACRLAGLQVHIQFGNHNEAKHKPPFIDLKEFLPHSYVKVKGIEKKIFAEHKQHFGLAELDAKVEYTKTCRNLPTYGVTFFLVKEQLAGKNKLVPRLLGVNKESVLRLDERTKEILKTWPLTTVRRWGASPQTFTLDFGDYSDQYYSVQTREAEQISQIISGYIDIILKMKRAKDHFGIEGEEGSTMIEEIVSPSKASIFQHESNRLAKVNTESVAKPAVMRAGTEGSKTYGTGHVGSAQYTTVSGQISVGHTPVARQQSQITNVMTGPQKALVSRISSTQETIKTVETELMTEIVIPDSANSQWKETTMSSNKEQMSSQIAAMNAATAQIITMTSGETDYVGVEEAIHSITTNLPEMTHSVKMIAALSPSGGDQLLDAARKLCTAFSDLLNAVQPQSNTSRQSLLNAASRVGEASRRLITEISDGNDESKDTLLTLAKTVANTTAALVIKAKSVAATVDKQQQAAVIGAATNCALATSQLVACTKVVASTVENPSCREQLVMAAKEVMNAMEELVSVCGLSVSEENNVLLKDLISAVAEVTTSLNRLISQVKISKVTPQKSVSQKEEMITTIVEEYQTAPRVNGYHTSEIERYIEEEQTAPPSPPVKYYTATVSDVIYNISQAMHRVSDSEYSKTFQSTESTYESHYRMVNTAKEIAKVTQEMMLKPWSSESKYDTTLSESYSQLSSDCINFVASDPNPETSERLSTSVRDLGSSCITAVKTAASTSPNNAYSCRERAEKAKDVAEKVSSVLSSLQACSRGTQACDNAASTVSGIIGDLDTIIMFATAGTLLAEKENETFADHRENILKTAKALVEDTKTLVAGAASSQEQLAVAAQNAVSTITQLAEVVKYGAASLGSDNPESQVMLINAVRDVANALGDLIQATKAASGKGINDPSMSYLKESARVMVTNLTSLLKTVKVVEDEHSRGTRALESTIEAIAQEIRALTSPSSYATQATPEELIRSTKAITLATAKAVAAGNSGKQEDVIIAANMGRKAISDMLAICKSCMAYAETSELRERVLQAGKTTALQYRELLQTILTLLRPNQAATTVTDPKQMLPQISRNIAQSVTELVSVAEVLKGTNWIHPDDPTMIAENELLGAAASIDAAARKLAALKPRRLNVQQTDESLNFNEMILEAAKSIAAATSALIKAASAAQRELVDTGKVSHSPLTGSEDGQWSEGLISAARLVAAATHSLVESANLLVQGVASEERLISAARQVASSTAQLLVACKVKADPDSETTKRLQAAGNAVKRATDNLVRAAQQAIQHDEERSLVLNKRMVGGIAQEINARSEVLRIERELEEARSRLTAIRLAKYKLKGDGSVYEVEAEPMNSVTA